jgi:uncharacterized membrane protein
MTNALHFVADRGMGDGFGRHRGGPLLPLLCMALLLGAVGLVVWLVLRRRPTAEPVVAAGAIAATVSPTFQAESILAERLARSEISPEDYRATLAALRGQPSGD